MYLLTDPYIPTSITLTGVTDASAVFDYDLDTYAEPSALAPVLTMDLGTAQVVDSVFLKGENLQDYDLSASNNNSTFTDLETGLTVPEHGNSFTTFVNSTAYRYWRISLSARTSSESSV